MSINLIYRFSLTANKQPLKKLTFSFLKLHSCQLKLYYSILLRQKSFQSALEQIQLPRSNHTPLTYFLQIIDLSIRHQVKFTFKVDNDITFQIVITYYLVSLAVVRLFDIHMNMIICLQKSFNFLYKNVLHFGLHVIFYLTVFDFFSQNLIYPVYLQRSLVKLCYRQV